MYDYISLVAYYERIAMMKMMGFSLGEQNEMIPFESEIMMIIYQKLEKEIKPKAGGKNASS